MIDLHSHILPCVDDGAGSMEEALWMARQAVESGIRYMVATPHYRRGQGLLPADLRHVFEQLQRELFYEDIPLQLGLAMEIYATDDLPQLLQQGKVFTYPDSNWFLVEFSVNEDLAYMDDLLARCAAVGYRPMIAHPERYYGLWHNPRMAKTWLDRGYGLQVDRDSLVEGMGQPCWQCADYLARHGWISCIASDAHRPGPRNMNWEKAIYRLRMEYGFRALGAWLEEFPEQIMKNFQWGDKNDD